MSACSPASLITAETRIKVSSTLDKSVGRKYLTDRSPETCWTSQQGLPQHIQLSFPSPIVPSSISLTFQGGFVGIRCLVNVQSSQQSGWETLTRIYPEDVNRKQVFDLFGVVEQVQNGIQTMKLVFEESSDFFGRITVYDLDIEGARAPIR